MKCWLIEINAPVFFSLLFLTHNGKVSDIWTATYIIAQMHISIHLLRLLNSKQVYLEALQGRSTSYLNREVETMTIFVGQLYDQFSRKIEVGHFHGLQFRLKLAFLSFVDWKTYILTNYFISKIPLDLFIMKYETVTGYHGYRIRSLFIYFIPMVAFFYMYARACWLLESTIMGIVYNIKCNANCECLKNNQWLK